ncbi:MAG TPA: hypothetical protein DCP02_01150 [Actinobacteria bacterium]|nr:hypothetical protein [Actinomycetota bacterium]
MNYDFSIYSKDEKRAKLLLTNTEFGKTLYQLFNNNQNRLLDIYFQHSRIWFRKRLSGINESDFRRYIEALNILIDESENLV